MRVACNGNCLWTYGRTDQGSGNSDTLFLASTQLASLASYLSFEASERKKIINNSKRVEVKGALGQRLDEIEDICISTDRFELIFRNLLCWFNRSKENIEFEGTSVKGLSAVKRVSK